MDINEEVALCDIVSFLDNVDKIDIKIEKDDEDITMNLSKNLNLSYAALEVQLNIRLEKNVKEKVGSNVLMVKFSYNNLTIDFLFWIYVPMI